MIIIAGYIDLTDPESRQETLKRSAPLQRATREQEPGCLAYVFSADPVVEQRIAVYELWVDEASLAAHFLHENFFAMGRVIREAGLAGSDNRKYRTDLVEPVYDQTQTPRADFFTAS